jgi:hypothetical protein
MTAVRDCGQTERIHAFAGGELTGDAAAGVRDHLATCAACQAELTEVLQLDAAVIDRTAGVVSLAWYRQRRVQLAAVAMAVAASAAIYLALPHRGAPVAHDAVAVVLAPRRAVEARLAWPGAAGYRAYDVPRAGEPPHESIAMVSLAALETRGDVHGLGALQLLNGERRQAARQLERAGDSADVLADRAALALADNQPEQALSLADAALDKAAGHAAAMWNRGLALRDLGLSRAASVAFREVAKRGEPGWSTEAQQRAASLDADADALQQRFDRLNAASVALARGKIELSVDDARAMPGFARGILYDAIRSATTPQALDALVPLAEAIDGADHDTAVADALARARTPLHPELSKQYGEMIRSLAVEMQITPKQGDELPVPAGTARRRFLAALRAAHADDLLIGVLMKTSKDRWIIDPAEISEFARLTAASPDPWMQILGYYERAQLALKQDDLVGAEAILLQAKQRCTPAAPPYRCIGISELLGQLYLGWQRLPEARSMLVAAWASARSSGEWLLQYTVLPELITLASFGDEAEGRGLPLVRAYTDELGLRYPASAGELRCQTLARGRNIRAMLLVDQLRFEAARRELAGPACAATDDAELATSELFVRAEIARDHGTADEVLAIREEIERLRARPSTRPPEQIILDHAEGRVLIERDPVAGVALLRRAIRAAQTVPESVVRAHKAAAWSYLVLVVNAARRGDGDEALALLAEEQHLALPEHCVVGVAIEDQRRAVVARGVTGKAITHYDESRTTSAIDARVLVTPDVVKGLGGCEAVDVIARPPVHGTSRLLGDAVAWRYLSQRSGPVKPPIDRSVVIANVEPPVALELPRLATWSSDRNVLAGSRATPSRAIEVIGGAGDVVIHAHGIVDVAQPDASFLALSPDADGRFALTTGDVRKARFLTSPLIVLAACHASRAAPVWHEIWSLPAAFVYAGARAVVASAAPMPDAEAAEFFDIVRERARTGASVAVALRDARAGWLARGRGEWVRDVIVFE